jgi:hypothetical protein
MCRFRSSSVAWLRLVHCTTKLHQESICIPATDKLNRESCVGMFEQVGCIVVIAATLSVSFLLLPGTRWVLDNSIVDIKMNIVAGHVVPAQHQLLVSRCGFCC